jgi:IS5 family transposase
MKADWSVIKRQFETGQHSIRALAKVHGISEKAIRKKRDKYGWERKLSAEVKARTREKIVERLAATKTPQSKGPQSAPPRRWKPRMNRQLRL